MAGSSRQAWVEMPGVEEHLRSQPIGQECLATWHTEGARSHGAQGSWASRCEHRAVTAIKSQGGGCSKGTTKGLQRERAEATNHTSGQD